MFLFAGYRPLPGLTLTPSLEIDGSRWTVTDIATPIYYRTGAFAVVNLNAEYQATKNLKFSAGVRYLFDTAYMLTYGYPEPGRSIYLAVKAIFELPLKSGLPRRRRTSNWIAVRSCGRRGADESGFDTTTRPRCYAA